MRTREQIDIIKQTESDPFSIPSAISTTEINKLLNFYFSSNNVIQKNTGPKVLKIEEHNPLLTPVIDRLKNITGDFDIRYAHFFDVTMPHMIHNDDLCEYPESAKAFTIPLKIYSNNSDVKLVVFDQHYYGGPVKFVNGANTKDWNVYYNTFLTDYANVDGVNNKGIDTEFKNKYLTHLNDSWLQGLSINAALPWKVRDILCFDSLALHCSTDFRNVGIERKIGLSIFTLRKQ